MIFVKTTCLVLWDGWEKSYFLIRLLYYRNKFRGLFVVFVIVDNDISKICLSKIKFWIPFGIACVGCSFVEISFL